MHTVTGRRIRRADAAIAAALLLLASPARAAPTCQDSAGDTVRCGAPGAMPVGWTLPIEARRERDFNQPPDPAAPGIIGVAALLVALWGMAALLPDFDGWGDDDWDEQEGDGRRRRRGRR